MLCSFSAQAGENAGVLIVDLFLNEQHMGDSFVLVDENGAYLVDEAVLLDWEIKKPWPVATVFRGSNNYAVDAFAGASASLRSREMRLDVSMPATHMPVRKVALGWEDATARSEAFGLYLDYELNWLNYQQSDRESAHALLQPVVFGKYGNITANTIYHRNAGNELTTNYLLPSGLSILELTYTLDDPEKMRSLRIGDIFTKPGSQGRALRIGGIQFGTNFETQPMFITHPLPQFFGEATVPTALDVYVNGQLRRQENVEPGSYVLEDVPVVNGSGQLQVVARDALGRHQIFTQDFYSSTELLREGLSEYSVSFGALRENYGFENFDYGNFAASGTWRYGFSDNVTFEGHGEVTRGLGLVSGATTFVIPAGGVVSASLGISSGNIGAGSSWHVGFRQQADAINYSVDVSGATQQFRLVGELLPQPRLQVFASAGRNFFELGALSMSFVHREFYARPKQSITSANFSKSLNRKIKMSAHLSYIDTEVDDISVGIRFSLPFGDRYFASSGFNRSYDRSRLTADLNKPIPLGNGYGYRIGASMIDDDFIDAGLTAQSEIGTYMLDVRDSASGGTVWQASTVGSVAYMAGMTNFTRQIRDAFAIVNVGEFEGVRVYAENTEIGRTNKNGRLFVPGLMPYLKNNLRIEIEDLPLNARIDEVQAQAAPYYKSGVVVNFDVSVSNNVLLRAVLPDGSPVPEGAFATINRLKKIYPVGQNGKLFLQGVDRSSLIKLRWQGLECDLDIPFPDSTAIIAKIGDIVCEPR